MKAIEVDGLSKRYVINHKQKAEASSLRELLAKPFKLYSGSQSAPLDILEERPLEKEEFWALKDVSFEIREGERVAIIGGNGAGKSTLLKILSRITEPTSGVIRTRGKVASLLEVGTGFHPELTGRENIFLNGAILGMRRDEILQKFDTIVQFSGVEKFIDTPVKHYSSGMYVRLAFSVASWLDPDILIVDEVLSVGDMAFQKRCEERMRQLTGAGRTVVFVSHSLTAVKAMCERAICLERGRVTFQGSVHDAVAEYKKSVDEQNQVGFRFEALSMTSYTSRGGSGAIKFDKLVINGRDFGKSPPILGLPVIQKGEKLIVELSAKTSDINITNGVDLAFAIDSGEGVRVFTAVSGWTNCTYTQKDNEIHANLIVENVLLRSGNYRVSIAAIHKGVTLDVIVDCAAFVVVGDEILGGIPFTEDFGMIDFPVVFS